MEWVEGIDLGHFIRLHREQGLHVEWPLVVGIGIATLRGLGAAHERRAPSGELAPVIHRDVTPHNILLGVNGVVKLTDFGLARARDRVASMTAPGTVKGKLSYLAPEVSFGKANTPQSDLFGVGSVMWETLTGERMFDGKTDVEIFKKIRACQIPPVGERRPDIPSSLAAVLDVALAPDPTARFASATAFAHALSQVMKQAIGVDPTSALGNAVRELKTSGKLPGADSQRTTELNPNVETAEVEPGDDDIPIELTKPKSKPSI
jgi:serine/threonine-protein kinase